MSAPDPSTHVLDDLRALASGDLSLVDLAGLKPRDTALLANVAAVAFQTERYSLAAQLFAGLEALEPKMPTHVLNLALSAARCGEQTRALSALERLFEFETPIPRDDRLTGLLLYAALIQNSHPARAQELLSLARALAGEV